jgi:DNA/RNA-binding domain of Phe-tRNA-synthetase-like protein
MGRPGTISMRLDAALRGAVRIGAVEAAPVAIGPSAEPLLDEITKLGEEMRKRYAGLQPAQIDGLAPARELYKSFGIDPTKRRPSSEALLRRVLQGKPLPRICNAVDLCNLLSLRFLLPLGLYDVEKVVGEAVLRRGASGESYSGIRKDDVHLEGHPVLADDRGAFGNPTSDSQRTAVGSDTRRLCLVIFAPHSTPAEELTEHVRSTRSAIERHLSPSGEKALCHVSFLD